MHVKKKRTNKIQLLNKFSNGKWETKLGVSFARFTEIKFRSCETLFSLSELRYGIYTGASGLFSIE